MTKNRFQVLVLTDHAKHSAENSVYALLQTMLSHPKCENITVASRSVKVNHSFFYQKNSDALHGVKIDSNFAFDPSGAFLNENSAAINISDYDLVFMRLPRPVSDDFLEWLANIFPNTAMINHPNGILQTSSKAFLLQFPEVCPSIQLCRSVEEVLAFAAQFPIVLKPLQEYGGKGLLKISGDILDDGQQTHDTKTFLTTIQKSLEKEGYLGMKYLKNVKQGDKRIIVVGGQILAASLRLPPPDSWLCNIAQGGTSVTATIATEEEEIIKIINPVLQKAGVLIYGADTLVDDNGKRVLSEVNTLSIGGFPQAEAQSGRPVISLTIDKIFEHVDAFYAR